jgi:hypothetical protein
MPSIDLGGVDVRGARHKPEKGEPTYGLWEHKASFGAEWVESAPAHEDRAAPAGLPRRARGGPAAPADAGRLMATIAERVRAAEPAEPKQLGDLIDRLAAEGRLRGPRRDGKAIGPAAPRRDRGPRRHPRLTRRHARRPVRRNSRERTSMATTSPTRAVRNGASALLVERPLDVDVPQVVVAATQPAARDRGSVVVRRSEPRVRRCRDHRTDGKTTTSFLPWPRSTPPGCRPAW